MVEMKAMKTFSIMKISYATTIGMDGKGSTLKMTESWGDKEQYYFKLRMLHFFKMQCSKILLTALLCWCVSILRLKNDLWN